MIRIERALQMTLLPDSLKDFVEEQAALGGYSTPSDYVRSLLRQGELTSRAQQAAFDCEAPPHRVIPLAA